MERTEKIKLLSDIKNGERSVHDLRLSKFYMLSIGTISEFLTGKEITVTDFCKRFIPVKDTLLTIGYTAYNLPPEYNFADPSGEVLSEIIKVFPELTEDYKQSIADCKDLRKTEIYKYVEGK